MALSRRPWVITPDRFLTSENIDKLLGDLKDRRDLALMRGVPKQDIEDYYIIRILLETGLRVFEFCTLEVQDINGLKLFVRHGKGDKPRAVLLTRSTHIVIQEWLKLRKQLQLSLNDHGPLFANSKGMCLSTRAIQKRVKLAYAKSGLPPHLSTHSLRHTYASLLLASGKVSLATVRDNLGHSSITITNLYSHACGSIEGIQLIPDPKSSEIIQKEELPSKASKNKSNDLVISYLRNANKKIRDDSDKNQDDMSDNKAMGRK